MTDNERRNAMHWADYEATKANAEYWETRMTKNQINTAAYFLIKYATGGERRCDTYREALEELGQHCAVIGHSGDLEDGGDRTYAWSEIADADDDSGAKSFAYITGRYDLP